VCDCSDPNKGISISDEKSEMLNKIKRFNYEYIYENPKFTPFKNYAKLIILELFNYYASLFDGENTLQKIESKKGYSVNNISNFYAYLIKYAKGIETEYSLNKKIYDLSDKKSYYRAVLDYISGMTDKFAVSSFNELITY
jgi:dGTPase